MIEVQPTSVDPKLMEKRELSPFQQYREAMSVKDLPFLYFESDSLQLILPELEKNGIEIFEWCHDYVKTGYEYLYFQNYYWMAQAYLLIKSLGYGTFVQDPDEYAEEPWSTEAEDMEDFDRNHVLLENVSTYELVLRDLIDLVHSKKLVMGLHEVRQRAQYIALRIQRDEE